MTTKVSLAIAEGLLHFRVNPVEDYGYEVEAYVCGGVRRFNGQPFVTRSQLIADQETADIAESVLLGLDWSYCQTWLEVRELFRRAVFGFTVQGQKEIGV